MNNQEILTRLYEIGKLPSEISDEVDDFPLDEFHQLFTQLSLPLDFEMAVKLINLSPPENTGCFGVEWTIVHAVEKDCDMKDFQRMIDCAEDGEVKRMLQERYNNYLENQSEDTPCNT